MWFVVFKTLCCSCIKEKVLIGFIYAEGILLGMEDLNKKMGIGIRIVIDDHIVYDHWLGSALDVKIEMSTKKGVLDKD